MSKFSKYIGMQFGNPHGFIGKICCLIMNTINRKMYKAIESEIVSAKNILDIGYGNGFLIQKLYKKIKAKIDGIDISNDMKTIAESRNKKAVLKGDVKLSVGNVCKLDSFSKTYDAITSVNTIYFWRDALQGLKEIYKVLQPNGIFYNAVYSKQWLKKMSYTKEGFTFFEKEDYISLGKEAGFSNICIKEISKGKSFLIMFEK